ELDKILISELEFHAHTGITEAEREIGQRYSLDLEVVCDLKKAGEGDDMSDSVDYAALCGAVTELGSSQTFVLAEALAESIARSILEQFDMVEEVMVRAKKLHPPVPAIKNYFAVEIRRNRDDVVKVSGFGE
ncbi:MAG: dihydroneopterin aldolase, partial [Planctomycetota bacterium]|nr:dihydroneopterin aldolase [Planctomycetota bacterium]